MENRERMTWMGEFSKNVQRYNQKNNIINELDFFSSNRFGFRLNMSTIDLLTFSKTYRFIHGNFDNTF